MTIDKTRFRDLVLRECRLIDRQLYRVVFEKAPARGLIAALKAYQNDDGGFGNGIEPDISVPSSSGIGLETALYYMDVTKRDAEILSAARDWLHVKTSPEGNLPHPPGDITDYPHQPWWDNPDEHRILSIAGLFAKLGETLAPDVSARIASFAKSYSPPDTLDVYHYPAFVYALYTPSYIKRDEVLEFAKDQLPPLIRNDSGHCILFGRLWYHFVDHVSPSLVEEEWSRTCDSLLEEDGGLRNPHADLPWWRPIITLDAMIVARRLGLI